MKLIIAYDGSECSEAAIEDLHRAGLPSAAEALVMSVADVFLPPPLTKSGHTLPSQVPDEVGRVHERAQRALKQAELLARQASQKIQEKFPQWTVKYEAFADSPAWAVIRKADEWKPDLIVVGAHGHTLLGGRLILGSVSQRILSEARCSVRVARSRRDAGSGSARILVGVDGSLFSYAAIDAIARRDWPKGTQVRLLAVVDTVMALSSNPAESPQLIWIQVEQEKDWDQVRKIFEPSVQKLRSAGLEAATMIRRGNPKDELLDEAETWGADDIFLGAKGIRGIERLLLGSVSSAVAARASCSVEIVRLASA